MKKEQYIIFGNIRLTMHFRLVLDKFKACRYFLNRWIVVLVDNCATSIIQYYPTEDLLCKTTNFTQKVHYCLLGHNIAKPLYLINQTTLSCRNFQLKIIISNWFLLLANSLYFRQIGDGLSRKDLYFPQPYWIIDYNQCSIIC